MSEEPKMPWDRKWHMESGEEEYLDGILSAFSIFQTVHKKAGGDRVVAYAFDDEDARLIAAAPETAAERDRLREINAELLEALKAWRTSTDPEACTCDKGIGPHVSECLGSCPPALTRAAITRAEQA